MSILIFSSMKISIILLKIHGYGTKVRVFPFCSFFYFLTTCVLLLITHHSYNSALRPILIPDINEVYILKIYMLIMKAFRMLILNMALVLIKFILKMCIILNDTSLITNTMYHYDTFEAPIYNSLFQTRIIHM